MLRALLATALQGTLVACACAQWTVPIAIILDGTEAEDRQVIGLSDPSDRGDALSADAGRANAATMTATTGTSVLIGDLDPIPAGYVTGMVVVIIPQETNDAGAVLDLNDLGTRPIVKQGDLPLDSADLRSGVPARLFYDGMRFRLLDGSRLNCPTGFHPANREYCIEDSSHAAIDFFAAMSACVDRGGRLCGYSEWLYACLSDPSFITTVLDYEWVDDATNNAAEAKRIGNGGDGVNGTIPGINCKHGGTTAPTNLHRYRCCMHR